MAPPPEPATPDVVLAAELVLGLLSPEAADAAGLRRTHDAAFDREVRRWEAELAHWLDDLPELGIDRTIPPATLERISNQAGPNQARRGRPWAALALAATMVLALLGGLWWQQRTVMPAVEPAAPAQLAVITLSDKQDRTVGTVLFDRADDVLYATVRVAPLAGFPELWLIEGQSAPRSLGELSPDGQTTVGVSRAVADALARGAKLAISIEPRPERTPLQPAP